MILVHGGSARGDTRAIRHPLARPPADASVPLFACAKLYKYIKAPRPSASMDKDRSSLEARFGGKFLDPLLHFLESHSKQQATTDSALQQF